MAAQRAGGQSLRTSELTLGSRRLLRRSSDSLPAMKKISLPYSMSPSSRVNRPIIATVLIVFLFTFIVSRLFVYLVLGHLMPNFFLEIGGVHVHHFTYGVFVLSICGMVLLIKRPVVGSALFRILTVAYGVGIGLTFDEFGMWIRLEDNYWVRQSYDAIIITLLVLLNITFWHEIKLLTREFVGMLRHIGQSCDRYIIKKLRGR